MRKLSLHLRQKEGEKKSRFRLSFRHGEGKQRPGGKKDTTQAVYSFLIPQRKEKEEEISSHLHDHAGREALKKQ